MLLKRTGTGRSKQAPAGPQYGLTPVGVVRNSRRLVTEQFYENSEGFWCCLRALKQPIATAQLRDPSWS